MYVFIDLLIDCIVIGFLIGSSYCICIDIKRKGQHNRKKIILFKHDFFFVYYFILYYFLNLVTYLHSL